MTVNTLSGADPDRLDAFAQALDQAAERLQTLRTTVGERVSATPWAGRRADTFRREWSRQAAATDSLTRTLDQAATTVRTNAADQRRASSPDGTPDWWERIEPERVALDGTAAALVLPGEAVIRAKAAVEHPAGQLKKVDKAIADIEKLPAGSRSAAILDAARTAEVAADDVEAWRAESSAWRVAAFDHLGAVEGLGRVIGGVSLLSDLDTMRSPEDSGVMGYVDQAVAGVNFGLTVADLAGWAVPGLAIPGVGEGVLLVTGAYLAGDFLYHHSALAHAIGDHIGHAAVDAGDWISHHTMDAVHDDVTAVKDGWRAGSKLVGRLFR